VLKGGHRGGKAGGLGASPRPIGEELQLRGGTEDESGQVVKVSGVMVCAGLVVRMWQKGGQGPKESVAGSAE
jgi:hypothetical protein